jgi:hypothetical protein
MSSIARVSVLTIPEGRIDEAAEAMRTAEEKLRGIPLSRFAPDYIHEDDFIATACEEVLVSLELAEKFGWRPVTARSARRCACITTVRPVCSAHQSRYRLRCPS